MATAAWVFTKTIFGFIKVSIMLVAIDAAGGELSGYIAIQAATYVWLAPALRASVETLGTRDLSRCIHQGDIAVDLLWCGSWPWAGACAAIGIEAEVSDVSLAEPAVEDLVRRIYAEGVPRWPE